MSDIFEDLHWLPVRDRIYFKIISLVHNCIHGIAPNYLQELLVVSSRDNLLLVMPRVHSKYGSRSFSFAGPKLWNALPISIRLIVGHVLFKSKLKHMFFTNSQHFHNKIILCV